MITKMKNINIIGSGNMAALIYGLLKDKVNVNGVFMRSKKNLDFFPQAKFVQNLSDLNPQVDLNIICVSDDSIHEVSQLLPENIPTVHTSGSAPLSILNSHKSYGVLYPFQTISKNIKLDLKSTPVFVEANESILELELIKFSQAYLSENTFVLSSEKREKIHLAGVFANNFTTLMVGSALEILKENSLDPNYLKPLLLETIRKTLEDGFELSQTGPARRGDKATMQKHISLLQDENQIRIYKTLSEIIGSKFKS